MSRHPLPLETLDHIFGYAIKGLEYPNDEFCVGNLLVKLIKVCRTWRAAGNRRLYARVFICADRTDKRVREYLPQLCRSFEENPALLNLVKEVYIEDIRDEDDIVRLKRFKRLLRLCTSVPRIILKGETPLALKSFKEILGKIKMRELRMTVGPWVERNYFFSSETELIHFIMALPAIEIVHFGIPSMFPMAKATVTSGNKRNKDKPNNSDRVLRSHRLQKPQTVLPLTCLDIMMDNAISTKGLEILKTLELPHLREFKVKYIASEHNDTLMLECLAKWPAKIEVLGLHRYIVDANAKHLLSKKQSDFVKALDRLSSLKELGIPITLVDLQYIFTRSSIKSLTIHNFLDDENLHFLASSLEKMKEGPQPEVEDKIPTFLPFLRHLTIFWWCPELPYYCPIASRMKRICRWTREHHRIKLEMNVFCAKTEQWFNFKTY